MDLVFDGNKPDVERLQRVQTDLSYMTNRQRFCLAIALIEMTAEAYQYDSYTKQLLAYLYEDSQVCLKAITQCDSRKTGPVRF